MSSTTTEDRAVLTQQANHLLRELNGADLHDLLAATMTELTARGARLTCGCCGEHRDGAESVIDTTWASIHNHDGTFSPVFFTQEAVKEAAQARRGARGRLSDECITEVRSRTNIVELLLEREVELKSTGKHQEFKGLCPLHAEDNRAFTVNAAKGVFYCHGCGKGGDAVTFVMEADKLTFIEAVEKLSERAGVDLRYLPPPPVTAGPPAVSDDPWACCYAAARGPCRGEYLAVNGNPRYLACERHMPQQAVTGGELPL